MAMSAGVEALLAAAIGLCASALLFIWWARYSSPRADTARKLMQDAGDSIVFIFEDDSLVDATPKARALLAKADQRASDWEKLLSVMGSSFPELRTQCAGLAEAGVAIIEATDGKSTRLHAEYWNGLVRVTLQDSNPGSETVDPLIAEAMEHELSLLRSIGENSPQLIWRRNQDGLLTWANRAYVDMVRSAFPMNDEEVAPWPPKDLFETVQAPVGAVPVVERQWLQSDGRLTPQCFEVTSVSRENGSMHFAIDVTAIVDAQNAQSKFVQTLTKTFAQLAVGLAVFDRERRLVLFNPALIDLLGLPAEFLISRPLIGSFLDRLREARMIPEPKDYTSWRHQMEALESESADGSYRQSWDLPNGLTYRVTGRPHPDGAIALLFEDISEELSLTRRFRSQINLGQRVLDSVDEAVAVFAPSGTMLMSNRAYRQLWQSEGHLGLIETVLGEQVALWEAACRPSPTWKRFTAPVQRESWAEDIVTRNGDRISCHYSPMANGDRLVRFTRQAATTAGLVPQRITQDG